MIIAGGGKIAARKARALAQEQAQITFIAPEFCEEVEELSRNLGFRLIERKAECDDFLDAFLVILATNDRSTNQSLAENVLPNQLLCVVDEQEEGNVLFPATLRRGHLQVAISTNGASPKLTKKIKKQMELQFDESWEVYTEFLTRCRKIIKNLPIPTDEKQERLENLLDNRFRLDPQAQNNELANLKKMLNLSK